MRNRGVLNGECKNVFQMKDKVWHLSIPGHVDKNRFKEARTRLGKQIASIITTLLNISKLNEVQDRLCPVKKESCENMEMAGFAYDMLTGVLKYLPVTM